MIRKVYKALLWGLLIFSVIVSLIVRFSHPDLTETQLFIDFAAVWLLVICAVLIAGTLLRKL